MKYGENNGMEEIGLVTPTLVLMMYPILHTSQQ